MLEVCIKAQLGCDCTIAFLVPWPLVMVTLHRTLLPSWLAYNCDRLAFQDATAIFGATAMKCSAATSLSIFISLTNVVAYETALIAYEI